MPTPTFQPIQGNPSTAQIQDYIVKLIRDLNYMLGNLDTLNVNRLDAKVLIAQSITAAQIAAGTITADKMNVTQLSAIAANMGTITAGNIYGAYIATANGVYPRIELSSAGNLLQAFYDASTYIYINPGVGGAIDPLLEFVDASTTSVIGNTHLIGHFFNIQSNQSINVTSSAHSVFLSAPSGNVSAQSSAGTISDLVASINSLNASISSLNGSITALNTNKADHGSTSSTSVSDGHNHGFTTSDYIQCYDSGGTPTSKKQWVPYGGSASHIHSI